MRVIMVNNDNIPARLLNGFNRSEPTVTRTRPTNTQILDEAIIVSLAELSDNEFVWDGEARLYRCTQYGYEVEVSRRLYRRSRRMRKSLYGRTI
jgi:hypothetical protein